MAMDNEQLVARIRIGEDPSGNMLKLWQQNERFIAKVAMKYQGYAELDDLKQEGYIGLCEAVRQYDPDKGIPFISYAAFWIRQAMRRYVDNCCSTVRIPVHAKEWILKYRKAVREYRKYYGEEPPERVLCALLGVDREKLHTIQKDARMGQIDSLSRPIAREDEDLTLADMVPSDENMEEDVIKALDTAAMAREVWLAVDQLPDDLPKAVRLRYQEGNTLEETGRILGISRSRANTLQQKALRMLGTERRGKCLRRYYEEYLAASPAYYVGVESFRRTHMSAVELQVLKQCF